MNERSAIIIAARRTAIGTVGGLHARRPIEALAAPVLQAVLTDGRIEPAQVDEVILGNAVGGGGNPARLIALAAGLPETTPAMTIDRQCASGLDAIVAGARMIESGAADAVIAGGAESPSTAPWRIAKPANLHKGLPHFFSQPAFAPGPEGDVGMIEAAENVARDYHITRERQDAFTLGSHRKAVAAADAGQLSAEIVRLSHDPRESRDEGPRASLTPKLLSRVTPLVATDGTVTSGNSCQVNDGAAAVLLVSDALHRKLGSPPGLVFAGAASAGIAPRLLGLAAVNATRKLAEMAGFRPQDIDAVELNEAFAAQVLATIDQLSLDPHKLNALGGALAYGHPYGASGALLVGRLFSRMILENAAQSPRTGLVMIAAAGGVGVAAQFRSTER
ncbi:MAG: thiolase family protein [Rhodomicrobiaceae bacterium]